MTLRMFRHMIFSHPSAHSSFALVRTNNNTRVVPNCIEFSADVRHFL